MFIADLGFDDGEIGLEPALLDIVAAIEFGDDLAVCKLGAVGGWRVEGRDAGTAGANAFGQSTLWHQFQLDFARQIAVREGAWIG